MSAQERKITPGDLMPLEDYARERAQRRKAITEIKRNRRLDVGPFATFYFESYKTMWQQVQEMLYIEKGGEAQVADELAAYNPLIPQGKELIATLMFEIDDPVRRRNVLGRLGGVEDTVVMTVADERIRAVPEHDVERSNAEGKASSVHFFHFPFTDAQIAKFRDPATQVVIGIEHPNYGHMAVMRPEMQKALAEDFA